MSGIFLSYRRDDAEDAAGRLYDALVERLPGVTIFRDIDKIQPGVKFDDVIRANVAASDVLVAMVSPRWLTITDDEGARRLDQPGDFVRLEIETAIARGIAIVPLLVGGAAMPRKSELPPSLAALTEWQNHQMAGRLWKESCDRLADALRPLVKADAKGARRPWYRSTTAAVLAASVIVVVLVTALGPVIGALWPNGDSTDRAVMPGPARQPASDVAIVVPTPAPAPAPTPRAAWPDVPAQLGKLALEGTWSVGGTNGPIDVMTVSRVGDAWQVAMHDKKPIRVDVRPTGQIAIALPPDGDTVFRATLELERRKGGDFAWSGAAYMTKAGANEVKITGASGEASPDLRNWKGRVTPLDPRNASASREVSVSLDLRDSDTLLRWVTREENKGQTVDFQKR